MKKTFSISTLAAIVAISATSANAGFYGAVRGSYADLQNQSFQSTDALVPYGVGTDYVMSDEKLSDGIASLKIAAGYEWNGFGAEIELAKFGDAKMTGDWTMQPEGPTCTDETCIMRNEFGLETSVVTAMFNASYTHDFGYAIKPFVMAGIGVAQIKESSRISIADYARTPINDESFETKSAEEKYNNFAWSIGAGAEYDITDNIAVNLSYRFTDLGTISASDELNVVKRDMSMHELIVGAKYRF